MVVIYNCLLLVCVIMCYYVRVIHDTRLCGVKMAGYDRCTPAVSQRGGTFIPGKIGHLHPA